jgi:hypothetical protein
MRNICGKRFSIPKISVTTIANVGEICADSPKPAGIYRKGEQCCHNDIEPIPKIEIYERSREFVCIASFDNYIQKALLGFFISKMNLSF